MQLNAYLVGAIVVLLLGLAFFAWREIERQRIIRFNNIKRFEYSNLYPNIVNCLLEIHNHSVEYLLISDEGLEVKFLLCDEQTKFFFNFKEHQMFMSNEELQILTHVLEEHLPEIADFSKYTVQKRWVEIPNGLRKAEYVYVIKAQHKKHLEELSHGGYCVNMTLINAPF